jgi:hypothetical protein
VSSLATDSLTTVTANGSGSAPFFAVSLPKLITLSVCTFGLYQLFWFYMNWRLFRERQDSTILPFWRVVFAYFFCYAMFKQIRDFPVQTVSNENLPAGALATGWVATSLLWKLPDPYALVCFSSFLFMVPVQVTAIRINEAVAPGHDRNRKFTLANWVTVVVGGLLLILTIIGSFLPEPSVVSQLSDNR